MSPDCVQAVVAAQQQTASLQLGDTVEPPALLAGTVRHPESRALQLTLQQYRITRRRVDTALAALNVQHGDQERGWLAGLRAVASNAPPDERPFSPAAKQALQRAAALADQMGSTTVRSHHVFLALMEYQENETTKEATALVCGTDEDETTSETNTNGVGQLLQKMNVLETNNNATALVICQSLLENLRNTADQTADDDRELVTGKDADTQMPTLASIGTDLTEQAAMGLLDPVYGRDEEIRRCVRTLLRRRKNNVVLLGDAGVGKTAVAEGVAQILVSKQCPAPLRGHRLVSVELSQLVAGTKYRGEFEERLQAVLKEVMNDEEEDENGNSKTTSKKKVPTILFFDEIHNLVGAGGAEGGLDASNQLKPALGARQTAGHGRHHRGRIPAVH